MRILKGIKCDLLFTLIVVIPGILATIYYLLVASPVYVSESRIVIKTVSDSSSSGFLSFLRTVGISDLSQTGSSIVVEFCKSRDTMKLLDNQYKIKEYFSRNGDIISRFNSLGFDNSDESFYKFYVKRIVSSWIDSSTGVVVIQTRAFDGETAYKLNKEILEQAENFVNLLNKRASLSTLQYYENKIKESRKKIEDTSRKLVSLFKKEGTVSPEAQIYGQVQLITELQKRLMEKKLELARIKSLAPDNPALKVIEEDVKKIEREIEIRFNELVLKLGKNSVTIELIKAELQTLQNELNAHIQGYIYAQLQASMKHYFLETIQTPTVPDKAVEPRRIRNLLTVYILSFVLWGILSLLLAGIKEHKYI